MHEISTLNCHMHYFLKNLIQKSALKSKNEEVNLKKKAKTNLKNWGICANLEFKTHS